VNIVTARADRKQLLGDAAGQRWLNGKLEWQRDKST